jgi:hypothetical protein
MNMQRFETDAQGNHLHIIDGTLRATIEPQHLDDYLAAQDMADLDVDLGLVEAKAGDLDPEAIVYYMKPTE